MPRRNVRTGSVSDMGVVSINEPVSVLAKFNGGKVTPLKFLWRRRIHCIARVTGCWQSKSGRSDIHHLSVVGENGAYYEISFNCETFVWLLNKVEAD